MTNTRGGLKVFSGLAVRAAFDDGLLAQFAEQVAPVAVEWNPTTVIEEKIARGETADLVIVASSAMDKLAARGIIRDASRKHLIDAYLGVAVAQGAPRPKIGTADEFFAAMKDARSVAWSRSGQSGIYLEKILAAHGLRDEVKARASTIQEGFTAERIVEGAADLAVQQVSELMVVKGVDIVGPFPDALQARTPFEIAVFEGAAHPDAAAAFIYFLLSSDAPCMLLAQRCRAGAVLEVKMPKKRQLSRHDKPVLGEHLMLQVNSADAGVAANHGFWRELALMFKTTGGRVILLVSLCYLLNMIDRNVVSIAAPAISHEFKLSKTEMGLAFRRSSVSPTCCRRRRVGSATGSGHASA